MKTILTLTLAAALGASSLLAAESILPYPVEQKTLPNGLSVFLVPMPSDGLVSYWTVVRTGSRDEVEQGVTGFAHFFEHMMFRGSETIPAAEYQRLVASMGADSNAFTSSDITAYYLAITREDLPTAIRIEADRFQRLSYDETVFRTEAGAVYGEYRKNRANPFSVLFEAMYGAAFDVHTYGHTTMGYEADIKQMPEQYEYSKTFFQRFYRPENVAVMVVGDFDRDATLAQIENEYGSWKKGYVAPKVPTEPEQTAARRIVVPFEGRTLPIVAVSWKGPAFAPTDRQMVAGALLGELAFGESSDLYKKLVLTEQRVEFISPSFQPSRDPGLWTVFARVKDPSDVAAVEAEIVATAERFTREEVGQQALDDARSESIYGFASNLTTPQSVASALARIVAITGGVEAVDQYYATMAALGPADLRDAAVTYLRPERSTVSWLHAAATPIPEASAAKAPVMVPQAEDPTVTISLWFGVGSQDDPAGKEGLAALVGRMLEEGGTVARSTEERQAALRPLAGSFSVSVDKEQTIVTGVVHRDLVSRYYDLFAEAILSPGFRTEDFARFSAEAASQIENGLRFGDDEELGKAVLLADLFAGSRYAHPIVGTSAGVAAITLDDVKAFAAKYFTRDNVTIGLGGAFERHPQLLPRLVADLNRLPAGSPEVIGAPATRVPEGRRLVLVDKPMAPATAISFGYPTSLARGSREFYATALAVSWLGEHRNSISHLYDVIREKRGLNYGDYAYLEAYPNGGRRNTPPTGVSRRGQLFEVWIRPVAPQNAGFALRAALREIDRLVEAGFTAEELEAHRAFLSKYLLQYATTSARKVGYALDDRFYGIDEPGHLARYREVLASLTLDEVNAAIRKHLRSDDLTIAIIAPNAAELREQLVSGAPTPVDYAGLAKPDEILAEDKEIEGYPLGIGVGDVVVMPIDEVFAK